MEPGFLAFILRASCLRLIHLCMHRCNGGDLQQLIDTQKKMSAERVKTAQERLEKLRVEQQQKSTVRVRQAGRDTISPQDRLQRLRQGQIRKPRGPELDR